MGKKLYVGNLSYSVDGAQLEEMFSKFGTVRSADVIQDRDTGRSKGFGFVEMSDDNAAREAVEALNGRDQDGRTQPGSINRRRHRVLNRCGQVSTGAAMGIGGVGGTLPRRAPRRICHRDVECNRPRP